MNPSTDKLLEAFELRLKRHYKRAYAEMDKKVKKYAKRLQRIDSEMRKALTDEEYAKWRKQKLDKLKQYTDMRDAIAEELVHADSVAAKMIEDALPEFYAEGFNIGVYQLEHDFGMDTAFTLYDKSTVARLIKDNPKLMPDLPRFELRVPRDLRWNKAQIHSELVKGILQGDSVEKIAKRLPRASTEKTMKGAIRRARTMVNGAENAGRVDSYKRAEKLGIEMVQEWMATLDNKTRHEHRMLDGQKVAVGDEFKIDGYTIRFPGDPEAAPEMVWNCRCTMRGDLLKYPREGDYRKDAKVGDMTYEEWKKARSIYGN